MDNSLIMLMLAVLGFCITTVGAFLKISKDFREEVKSSKTEMEENMSKTVRLLFQRFDDHKDSVDKKFLYQAEINDRNYAQQNMCNQTKEYFGSVFKEIKDSLIRLENRIAGNG